MAPQDDLTTERAAELVEQMLVFIEKTSRRKLSFSTIVDMHTGKIDNPQDRLIAAVIKHDKQTRQEALREAANIARIVQFGSDIADELDRLAHEE